MIRNCLFVLLLAGAALIANAQVAPSSHAQKKNWKAAAEDPAFLHQAVKDVTDVIVYDIFSPPVSSRIYAYFTVAGYEAARFDNPEYLSLAGQLHGLSSVPAPDPGKQYCFPLAAVEAALQTGRAMVISESKLAADQNRILQQYKETGMPESIFENSVGFGKAVADHILAWAAKDKYRETRSLPKYTIGEDSASWKPTPPAYMKAVEPSWNRLRTFLIDSAQEFKPAPPFAFSTDKNSTFYKEARLVYDTSLVLTPEQKEIANFWDCNPFKMNISGHVMYGTKKISPNGHWINITQVACKKVHAGFLRSAEAYACLSVVMADAIISCWDEKYRSVVIRPETYINQYIDENWMPVLQTPPFPEYTSGHSIISSSAAVMLTRLFGGNFSFTDSTESEFGLAPRHFSSFQQASEEAAISRMYGGIHYMAAIKSGLVKGKEIGRFFGERLRMRK